MPTDDPELLDTALQVLDDWAEGILFDPDEVERERGVVTEEWRSDRSAETRAYEAERRILYQGSRHAKRDVIGTPETLAAMGRDNPRRFYDEWYRPELMAVMVVGPVDADAVESRIVELFSDNTNPADARPREEVALPCHDGIRVSMSTDAELSDSTVMLYETQDWRWPTTVAGVRALLVEDLVSNLLWARFDLRRQDVDAPFLDAENGDQDINRGQQFRYLWAEARVEEAAALTGLVAEVRRAQRHGFTQQELDQVRTETLDRARSWVRRPTTPRATKPSTRSSATSSTRSGWLGPRRNRRSTSSCCPGSPWTRSTPRPPGTSRATAAPSWSPAPPWKGARR